MITFKKVTLAAALLAATVVTAGAAPTLPPLSKADIAATTLEATPVQYRRSYYYGGWRRPVVGLGIGAGIVAGAIIANQAYRPRRGAYYDTYAYDGPYYYPAEYRGDPRKICADHFRSFEWRTGLYTTYGGERKTCPYLLR